MSLPPPLRIDWQGSVCRLVLDRPAQANALSAGLVDALDGALAGAATRGATLLTIEGAGRHFCAGFDLSSIAFETDDSLLARFTRIELMLQRLHRMPCPTVAFAHGRAMGAGADLFAACTHRLARAGSAFAFPGFSGFGLVLGTRRLAARVGEARALDWVGSGRLVDAAEALASGLGTAANDEPDTLRAACNALAASGTGLSPALRHAVDGDDARDLAALVRSAAAPGLRDRVAAYVARASPGRRSSADAQSANSAAAR